MSCNLYPREGKGFNDTVDKIRFSREVGISLVGT